MAKRIPDDAMARALAAAGAANEAADGLADEALADQALSDDALSDEPEGDEESVEIPDGEIPDKLYFRIGEVASLVGVDAHVLRYWESEFRMKPHRSSSGQRLYRKQDLSRFFRIKRLLHDEGYTIAGARKVLTGGSKLQQVDLPRIRAALDRVQELRSRILELRDDLDPHGRA